MKYQIKYILFIIIFVSTIKSEEIIIDYEEEKEYNANLLIIITQHLK